MAKKKKTRKQKVLSDLRHHHIAPKQEHAVIEEESPSKESPRSSTFTYALDSTVRPKETAKTHLYTRTDYHYISHDLKKTAILTTAIVFAQLALYFLMNRP